MFIDISGQRFGRILVESFSHMGDKSKSIWNCLCDCGLKVKIRKDSLHSGRTKSCGCLKKETAANLKTTHGLSHTRLYSIWEGMLYRCSKSTHVAYKYYGGRGIKVCERWLEFINFYNDMWPSYKETLTLDRIDNNGNYEPGNVRWVTRSQNNKNRRNSQIVQSNIDHVVFDKFHNKWDVKFSFKTQEEAEKLAKYIMDNF